MDGLLVVNAGSSSVKFQVFSGGASGGPARKLKGQMDGIGARPRLRVSGANGKGIVDRELSAGEVPDVPAALHAAAAWLREEQLLQTQTPQTRQRFTAD